MKKITLLVLLIFSLLSPTLCSAKGKRIVPRTGPRLVIASFEHHFKGLKHGTPLIHSFIVKNRGKGKLIIEKVEPDCGCTATHFDKEIAPGKEGKITLEFKDTEGILTGEVTKGATVWTNDPKHKKFYLVMRGSFVQ
jgi:hypothetical protein